MREEKLVIGVTGMPGSGKSVVDREAEDLGLSVVVMGDIIREEVAKKGCVLNPENVRKVTLQIRKEKGPAIIAKKCIPKITGSKNRLVIIDGIRSLAEVEFFRGNFSSFKLLTIHSSPETRFQRIFKRKRSDDPSDWHIFSERDLSELEIGIGSVIALADHVIINEGTLRHFKTIIRRFLKANMT